CPRTRSSPNSANVVWTSRCVQDRCIPDYFASADFSHRVCRFDDANVSISLDLHGLALRMKHAGSPGVRAFRRSTMSRHAGIVTLFFGLFFVAGAEPPLPTKAPLVRVVDLKIGESQEVELANQKKVMVKLLDLQETCDDVRSAVRAARVKVEVDGTPITLA